MRNAEPDRADAARGARRNRPTAMPYATGDRGLGAHHPHQLPVGRADPLDQRQLLRAAAIAIVIEFTTAHGAERPDQADQQTYMPSACVVVALAHTVQVLAHAQRRRTPAWPAPAPRSRRASLRPSGWTKARSSTGVVTCRAATGAGRSTSSIPPARVDGRDAQRDAACRRRKRSRHAHRRPSSRSGVPLSFPAARLLPASASSDPRVTPTSTHLREVCGSTARRRHGERVCAARWRSRSWRTCRRRRRHRDAGRRSATRPGGRLAAPRWRT